MHTSDAVSLRKALAKGFGALILLCGSAVEGQDLPAVDERPAASFGSRIEVRLVTIEARAVDWAGRARRGLGPDDFVVEVGGRRQTVEAADWIEAGPGVAAPETSPTEDAATSRAVPRRIVVFVQSSAEPHRYLGFQKLLAGLDRVLERLHPSDLVAVVSFQYHLEPRLDFTTDHGAVRNAIERSALLEPPPDRPRPGDGPALGIEPGAAEGAAFVEDGLRLVAEAMTGMSGEKRLLYLGWGLGSEHGGDSTPRYRRAIEAMRRAPLTVSSIGVGGLVFGVASNLDLSMGRAALDTGGVHVRLEPFPDLAMERFAATLDGYYLLTFAVDRESVGRLQVRLTDGHGRVHFPPRRLVRRARSELPDLEDATTDRLAP